MKQKVESLPNLTALRGIAALLVVVFHFDSIVMHLNFPNKNMFLYNCYLMVDLFFILSGFILFHVYGRNFSNQLEISNYFRYIRARFARIYPLHFFLLLVFCVIVFGSLNPYMSGTLTHLIHNPKALVTNLLLLQSFGIHSIFTWNLPSWSISAEWCAYLLFPFLVFFISKQKTLAHFFMILSVVTMYWLIAYYLPRTPYLWNIPNSRNINVTFDFGYLRGLAGFISGMLSYQLFRIRNCRKFLSKDGVGILLLFILVLAMNKSLNHLICIPLFMLLVISWGSNTGFFQKLLLCRPLQLLGDISYSIYMIHYLLILCVAIPMVELMGYKYTGPGSVQPILKEGLFFCLMFLSVVVFVSAITYRWIENPFRKRLTNRS